MTVAFRKSWSLPTDATGPGSLRRMKASASRYCPRPSRARRASDAPFPARKRIAIATVAESPAVPVRASARAPLAVSQRTNGTETRK
jgi:hypothetical protein